MVNNKENKESWLKKFLKSRQKLQEEKTKQSNPETTISKKELMQTSQGTVLGGKEVSVQTNDSAKAQKILKKVWEDKW